MFSDTYAGTVYWKGGRDKIKRSIMIGNKQKGGLRAPDINLMIEASRINWIKRYLSPPESAQTWKCMVKTIFPTRGNKCRRTFKEQFQCGTVKTNSTNILY